MLVELKTKPWSLTYHVNTAVPYRKYSIHLTAISDDAGNYPVFPISVEERGKPGHEVFIATYPNLTTATYTSLPELAFEHSSQIVWFESVEDYN